MTWSPFPGLYEVIESLSCPHSHFKARQLFTGRLVLLKTIPFGPDHLLADAKVMASVRHPNVAELLDVLQHEGRTVLVREFLPNRLFVERGAPWPILQAVRLMEKVARGVHAVHEAGYVHGKLSLSSILLTEDGEPKLCGLEAPCNADRGAMLQAAYHAPEQLFELDAAVAPSVDLFALGAIMYCLLTGSPPFRGATALETLQKVRTASAERPRKLRPKLPRELERICLKCLQKDPRHRYATAADLAEDLARFLSRSWMRRLMAAFCR